MAIKYISREDIDKVLEDAGNHFLSVTFAKKDGSIRNLNGHLHVHCHTKGGESTIKHKEDLVGIWDRQIKQYRSFSKDRVKSMRVNGDVYKIKGQNND